MLHPIEKGHTTTQIKYEHGARQAPKVQLLAVSKWVLGRGAPVGEPNAHQQKHTFKVLTAECAPSDGIAELTVIPATVKFVMAMETLPPIAPRRGLCHAPQSPAARRCSGGSQCRAPGDIDQRQTQRPPS